jgi:hypothetical protein
MRLEASASWPEDTGGRLGLALVVSLAVHAGLVLGVTLDGVSFGAPQVLRAQLVPVPAVDATRVSPPTESQTAPGLRTAAAPPEAVPETAPDASPGATVEGSSSAKQVAGAEPPVYYAPQDVDVRATPVGMQTTLSSEREMLLGRLVTVRLRLYISDAGIVDRFDVLQSDGLTDGVSLDDVKSLRFNPAQKNGRPVGSQKTVELTFGR